MTGQAEQDRPLSPASRPEAAQIDVELVFEIAELVWEPLSS
jgi:hypothetical protein